MAVLHMGISNVLAGKIIKDLKEYFQDERNFLEGYAVRKLTSIIGGAFLLLEYLRIIRIYSLIRFIGIFFLLEYFIFLLLYSFHRFISYFIWSRVYLFIIHSLSIN